MEPTISESPSTNEVVPPIPSTNEVVPPIPSTEGETKEIKLIDVPVDSPNTALNIIVSFLNLAQKRGVFGIDESSKIWECIKMFQQQQ
jgi:hypothetical protein